MSTRYEDYETDHSLDDSAGYSNDREISLGTTTVLGIFLALAVVCGLFFGFGYSMGRRSVPSPLANVSTDVSSPLPDTHLTPGSLPGSTAAYIPPTDSAAGTIEGTTDTASGAHAPRGQHTKPPAASAPTANDSGASPSVESVERQQIARAVAQAAAPGPHTSGAPASPSAVGSNFVQITAISPAHRADADMLIASLRHKGYDAAIRTGSADDLLHVQLGPFSSRKEAEAMRQRLSIDGYNSILK